MSIPLTTFKGNLKFTRPGTADEIAADAFQFSAPGFFDVPKENKPDKPANKLLKLASKMGFTTMHLDTEPKRRRYAGDQSLSRGSYFAICNEGTQWDNGLLINEINSYRIPEKNGFSIVGDLYDEAVAEKFNEGVQEFQFLILIGNVDLFVKQFPKYKGIEKNGRYIVIKHPYTTEYREIDNVIDLRLPATRDWFFETFQKGDGIYYKKENGKHIQSFYEMLPAMLHINLGGFHETQGIGIWMRHNKVNGFIYPSARTNAEVVIQNGELVHHSGWNLLDYRSTHENPFSNTIVDISPWFSEIFNGVHFETALPESPYFGSLKIQGVEEFHTALYEARLKK